MYFLVLISLLKGACRSCLAPAAINILSLELRVFQTTLARVLSGKCFLPRSRKIQTIFKTNPSLFVY